MRSDFSLRGREIYKFICESETTGDVEVFYIATDSLDEAVVQLEKNFSTRVDSINMISEKAGSIIMSTFEMRNK